jgi:hypothetical protein
MLTRVIAGGCLLGPMALRQRTGDDAPFLVPQFEISGVDANAFHRGDLLEIPPGLCVHPAFQTTRLRVIARDWRLCRLRGEPVWELVLLCSDADPIDSAERYTTLVPVEV